MTTRGMLELLEWLDDRATGGHPDQVNPDERFRRVADVIRVYGMKLNEQSATIAKLEADLSASEAEREMWKQSSGLKLEVIERLGAENARLRLALTDWWAEATGHFERKSCGHDFTCICISEKVKAALAAKSDKP